MEKYPHESALSVTALDTMYGELQTPAEGSPERYLAAMTGEYEEDIISIDPRVYVLWMTHALAPFSIRLLDNDSQYESYRKQINQLYNRFSGHIDDMIDHPTGWSLWEDGLPQCGDLAASIVDHFATGTPLDITEGDRALIREAALAQHTFSEDPATDPTYDSSLDTMQRYHDRITTALINAGKDETQAKLWSTLRIGRYLYHGLLWQHFMPIVYDTVVQEDGIHDRLARQYHPPVEVYIGAMGDGKSTCDKAFDQHRGVTSIVRDRFRRISLENFANADIGEADYVQWTEDGSRLMRKWAERWASRFYYRRQGEDTLPLCPPLRFEFVPPSKRAAENSDRIDAYYRYPTAHLTLVTASPGTALRRTEARTLDNTSASGYGRQHSLSTFIGTHRNSGRWVDLLLQVQKDADPSKHDLRNYKHFRAVNNEVDNADAPPIFIYLPEGKELEIYSLSSITALSRLQYLRSDLTDKDKQDILQNSPNIYEEGRSELAANIDDLVAITDHVRSIGLHGKRGSYAIIDMDEDNAVRIARFTDRFPTDAQEVTLFDLFIESLCSKRACTMVDYTDRPPSQP